MKSSSCMDKKISQIFTFCRGNLNTTPKNGRKTSAKWQKVSTIPGLVEWLKHISYKKGQQIPPYKISQ